MVKVAVMTLSPETVASVKEKQPFVSEGLLVTVNEIVPVYPFWGVMVTVEEPELPAAMVTLVAESVKVGVDDEVGQALSRL